MKKVLSLVLVIAVLLMLGGCSAKDKLVGTWEAELDLTAMMNEEIGADEEMGEYFSVESFKLKLVLTFTENGTYTMTVDEDSVEAAMDSVKSSLTAGFEEYVKDLAAGMGLENVSATDFLASMGLSMEEMVSGAFDAAMEDDMFAELNAEGNFDAKDGKLYLSDGTAYGVNENEYENYTLEGDTLTLVSCVTSGELTEMQESLYPMVFTKAAE